MNLATEHSGKIFACVALNILQKLAMRVYQSHKVFDWSDEKNLHTPREDWMSYTTAEYDYLEDMDGTVWYNRSSLKTFPIRNGVKRGCAMALTFFGYSVPCCFPMHSAHLQKTCAYIQGLVESCSTWPICVRKPRYDRS